MFTRPDRIPAGSLVGERYRIEAPIAGGGFGFVYRASDLREPDGAPVAVKILRADLIESASAIARFEREARLVALMQHPNIVKLLDFGHSHGEQPYFVMELLEGQTLAERVAERRMAPDELLAVLEPLCAALDAAHGKGIVHRDIKASNVFLDRRGERDGQPRVVLLDFGVAKLADDTRAPLTKSREAVGTLACMAPEQILGAPVDERTDVYALGVLAYRMLTGSPPFAHDIVAALLDMHLHAPPPPPSRRAPIPDALDQLVQRAMAKHPDDRPDDAAAFTHAFRAALEPETPAARGPDANVAVVYAQLTPGDHALGDPDRLDELDDELERVVEALRAAGMTPRVITDNAALLVAGPHERTALLALLRETHARAAPRLGADATLALIAHVGPQDVVCSVSRWLPSVPVDGVFATAALAAPDSRDDTALIPQ